MKFYAVKKGKQTGIFTTWLECETQVKGFPGAVYKSFPSKEEAKKYLLGNQSEVVTKVKKDAMITVSHTLPKVGVDDVVAYVDGSYNSDTKEFSYGIVIFFKNVRKDMNKKYNDKDLAPMRNVAGEIKGAETAMRFAIDNGAKRIFIYYDYEGIEKWCTGDWEAKKEGTKKYKQFYNEASSQIEIVFVKVKAHTGDTYNEEADKLAKKAVGLL